MLFYILHDNMNSKLSIPCIEAFSLLQFLFGQTKTIIIKKKYYFIKRLIAHILPYFYIAHQQQCWATQFRMHLCMISDVTVYFYQEKAFDCSATNKNELLVITNYIILSVTWQITSGNHVKNMSQISLHMEKSKSAWLSEQSQVYTQRNCW